MKRPSPATYIFGNPVSLAVIGLGACGIGYEWWIGEAPGLLAVIAAGFAIVAMNAYERLQRYGDWKREWEAMGGNAPGWRFASFARAWPRLRIVLGLSAWGLWAYFVFARGDQPDMDLPVFWPTTGVMILAGAHRFWQYRRNRRLVVQDVAVGECLPVPRQSPSLAQAIAVLPTYCHGLICDDAIDSSAH